MCETFNLRILAFADGDHYWFEIHRVYYQKGEPVSHGETGVTLGGSSISEVRGSFRRAELALTKRVLWGGKRFPEEFETE